ncbi:hypothetical protein JCM24511_03279 [Saitozyma sp. JCM 24511]|nr:hypothetical protein JCM24511_03279 [Saitozyma sp. JCM 24511]
MHFICTLQHIYLASHLKNPTRPTVSPLALHRTMLLAMGVKKYRDSKKDQGGAGSGSGSGSKSKVKSGTKPAGQANQSGSANGIGGGSGGK